MQFSVKYSILFLISISISFIGISQSVDNNKDIATILGSLNNWCSDNGEYSTDKFVFDQPQPTCKKLPGDYGKWFRFMASTTSIEIQLKIGKEEGSLQFPFLFLWDESLNEIECKKYDDWDDDLVINNHNLQRGKWYYFTVSHMNKQEYSGTFTLCMNDEISNDFKEGAIELEETTRWCSEDTAFTTKNSTGDGPKPSCLSKGPNYNRWFKFMAKTKFITIQLDYDGSKNGRTAQFPYLTLWNEQEIEVTCKDFGNGIQPISLQHIGLSLGQWYYISVDHGYNASYPGSFSLCIDDGDPNQPKLQKEVVSISGKILNTQQVPIAGNKVVLLNKNQENINHVLTDEKGKFSFKNLPENKNYLVRIEKNEPGMLIDIYMSKPGIGPIKKSVMKGENLFEFVNLPANCGYVTILDCKNLNIEVVAGKNGILGKVVRKNDLTQGISNLNVLLYDSPKNLVASTKTDTKGSFKFENVNPNTEHLVKLGGMNNDLYAEMVKVNSKKEVIKASTMRNLTKDGFFRFETLPKMDAGSLDIMATNDIALPTDFSNLNEGTIIRLNNIYFDEGKFNLLSTSHKELNRLIAILNKHSEMKISIEGHTDNQGSKETNQTLSTNRAKAVVAYLTKNGINTGRLSFIGYGATKKIANNSSPEGRKKNRRVEFRIISK